MDSTMMIIVVCIMGLGCMCVSSMCGLYYSWQTGVLCQMFPSMQLQCPVVAPGDTPPPGASGPAPAPPPPPPPATPTDCKAKALVDCTGKRGKDRDNCIKDSRKACEAGNTVLAEGSVSPEYGDQGNVGVAYDEACPAGGYLSNFTFALPNVAPVHGSLTGKQRRVSGIEYTCTNQSTPKRIGGKSGTYNFDAKTTSNGCAGGFNGMSGFTSSDAVQRLLPKCSTSEIMMGQGGNTGEYFDFNCPEGQKMYRFQGRIHKNKKDIKTIRFWCR